MLMKTKLNGIPPTPRVLVSPGVERNEAERSDAECSAAPGETKTLPDPEVVVRAQRRQFTADYKRRILAEADAAKRVGATGALLRREGLYSSHLTHWRQQRDSGLAPHRRGPKPNRNPLSEEVRNLKRQNDHLTQRLARAELIIDVQKKVSLLLGIPLAAVDNDESNS
jgi:transposase